MTSNESRETGLADRWAMRVAAAEALRDILSRKHHVRDLEILEAKRVVKERWVFVARLNGRKVVIKRFLSGDPAATVAGLKAELDYLETIFTGDGFGVTRCLHAWPDSGIAVLNLVPGPRLGAEIKRLSGEERSRLLAQSGEWLRRYCAPRQQTGSFGPRFWIRKIESLPAGRVFIEEDRELLGNLLACLRRQAEMIKGVPVLRAATHGDYSGVNAHLHEGTIYGIDIQGECRFPVAKDVARFLVWVRVHEAAPSDRSSSGISSRDFDAFLGCGILSAEERGTTLPFFIGTQFYEKFVGSYDRRDIREATRRAIRSYIHSA